MSKGMEVTTGKTALRECVKPLDPIIWCDAWPPVASPDYLKNPNYVLASGWKRARNQAARGLNSWEPVAICYSGSTATPPVTEHGFWGIFQEQGVYPGVSDARVNLAGLSVLNQGSLPYFSGCAVAQPPGVIVEYSSQAPVEIDFTTAAIYVASTAPNDVQLTWASFETSPDTFSSAVVRTLSLADFVEFEDGIENEFTIQIIDLVKQHGRAAVEALAAAIFRPDVRPEVIAQTLLCFARIDDEPTVQARARALRRGLLSRSAVVRDAATVGIAATKDTLADPDLVSAIAREKIRGLKEDMQGALSYLRSER